jgi:two-component system response regulator
LFKTEERREAGIILKNKQILLVDDNQDDLALTKRALRKLNFNEELVIANDGVEALQYIFGDGGDNGCAIENLPSLVLLDLKMPRLNGLEVLRKMRSAEKTKLVPIVMFTSSNEEKDIIASRDLGANKFIQKPLNVYDFNKVIAQIIFCFNLQPNSTNGDA